MRALNSFRRQRKKSSEYKIQNANRPGYVFLISVLVVGTIGVAVAASALLLGLASERSSYALEESAKAYALAQSCAEQGLRSLRANPAYIGGETFEFPQGTCDILLTRGAGNENRTLCAEGISGESVRRFQIIIARLLPSVRIYSWQEVSSFTLCDYPS